MTLIATLQHGKTNQFGRQEIGCAMRNKDVKVCAIGALAMYLFYRFDVEKEPIPDLSTKENWYRTKVLRATKKDCLKQMTYKAHYEAVNMAFKALGLKYKAKTHVGRGSGVRTAELLGTEELDLRRMGRWNSQSMEGSYLSRLPRGGMRALAGFDPRNRNYYISRAALEVPMSLQRCLFKGIDIYTPEDVAGAGFVALVKKLRIVMLQDAVFLTDTYKGHDIWTHPLWGSAQFLTFKRRALQQLSMTEDPRDVQLEAVLPRMCDVIQTNFEALRNDLYQDQAQRDEKLNQLTGTLGRFEAYINALRTVSLNSAQIRQSNAAIDTEDETKESDIATYRMNRFNVTVKDLWREWHEGIGDGPSIVSLEKQYGVQWRSAPGESKYFTRRKKIIAAVRMHAEVAHMSEGDAIEHFDYLRGSKSLDWLSKNIADLR